MNVIFTCGGTAGHVNPALALAGFLRERDPKTRILFVGAERGLERDLIAHTPYPFRTVNISSFHRSLRPKELRHNLVSVRNLMHAKREADAILDEFQPDLIVGTGGYASYPVVRYGHARGHSDGGARVERRSGADDPTARKSLRPHSRRL